ncbi:MAG: glycoside hydrolase family 76 protein [Candidatus Hodarchaeota archaeon]
MIKNLQFCQRIKKWIMYSFLSVLILGMVLPSFTTFSSMNLIQSNQEINIQNSSLSLDFATKKEPFIPLKIDGRTEDDPEAYFPNFLFYSVKIANTLIDYLYDNDSGGFYISTNEQWLNSSTNYDKRTYDNAQAILALLKLSDAVINQTEREFALNIAEKTANCLITDLYDEQFNGFFIRQSNRLKKPGIQAKAIQAFLSLYETTSNLTYRDIAINTFNFLDEGEAWDDSGYYAYLLSHSGLIASSNPDYSDPYDPQSKRVDHNVLMGDALLDLYRVELTEKYLTKAQRIYDFFNSTCRNTSTGLFYTGLNVNNELIDNESADIFINSLVLEFLAHLYNITEDVKYYDDFFILLNAVLNYFWDSSFGGFYATYSYLNSEVRDMKKYTERQFYGIKAFDEAYKLTDNSLYYNLILDVVEFLNDKLYDQTHEGYYQLTNNDGSPGDISWNNKYTVTQSLAIYALANLWLYSKPGVLNAMWAPSTPRPQDSVTIFVAAFDSDGLSNVLFNYSINNNPYQYGEMVPHPLIGNMYNLTLPSHSDGTTVNFNIIVNDTLGNQAVRGSYFFLWQNDVWPPHIQEIGFDPGMEIPVDAEISITVSAQDVPIQGDVRSIRMYYHLAGKKENSIALEQIDIHLWKVTFPEGFSTPGTYAYYFEAIDSLFNFGYSSVNYFYILGHQETLVMSLIIGGLFIVFILTPGGIYTYVYNERRKARTTLKSIKRTRGMKRRKKRGTKRMS